jgi:hypothetical protein
VGLGPKQRNKMLGHVAGAQPPPTVVAPCPGAMVELESPLVLPDPTDTHIGRLQDQPAQSSFKFSRSGSGFSRGTFQPSRLAAQDCRL